MNGFVRMLLVAAFAATRASGFAGASDRVLGYHLDISNCKVPRLEMLFRIADILQKLGYNHMQMNTEHTFAYSKSAIAKGVTDETIATAKAQHAKAKALFDPTRAPQWIRDDFALLDLVCTASEVRATKPNMANFRATFEPEYRRLWQANSRPGGLEESLNINFGH